MRTNTTVQFATAVAIEAQHLKRVGKPLFLDPSIYLTATAASTSTKLTAVRGTIVVHVVDGQKAMFALTTASALSSVGSQRLGAQDCTALGFFCQTGFAVALSVARAADSASNAEPALLETL